MIVLNITCENHEQAAVYLNANNYLNLLLDMSNALRRAEKSGSLSDFVETARSFTDEIHKATEHHTGAY